MKKPVRKTYLVAAAAAVGFAIGALAGEDAVIVEPEVVEVQPALSENQGADQKTDQQHTGNTTPGPGTRAVDKTKELSTQAWEATKEGVSGAVDYSAEKAGQAWEATKEGTGKAVDWTKEKSEQAWDATKETADKAGESVKRGYEKTKEKTRDLVNDE